MTTDHTRIINQLNEGHTAMNKAGLGSPALDAFHNLQVQLISESPDPWATVQAMADLMDEHRTRVISPCRVFPAWCTSPGEHDDHSSAEYTVRDTRGAEMIAAHVLYFSGSTPIVGIAEDDFSPDEAREKAEELRWLADRVDELAGHAEKARG